MLRYKPHPPAEMPGVFFVRRQDYRTVEGYIMGAENKEQGGNRGLFQWSRTPMPFRRTELMNIVLAAKSCTIYNYIRQVGRGTVCQL